MDSFDFHSLEQVLTEVQAGCRRSYGSFVFGEYGLVTLVVDRLNLRTDPLGQRRLAQFEQGGLEFVVIAVEQETQRPSTGSRIVDHLGHQQVVVTEIEFVSDPDLAGRIHQNIPQPEFPVQLAQQEDLDLGARFLFVAVQAGRKHLGIVESENIPRLEIIDYVFENPMLDFSSFAVQHHQPGFVPALGRIFGQHIGREIVIILR